METKYTLTQKELNVLRSFVRSVGKELKREKIVNPGNDLSEEESEQDKVEKILELK
jgi:DNA-binding response OmpR family regulator